MSTSRKAVRHYLPSLIHFHNTKINIKKVKIAVNLRINVLINPKYLKITLPIDNRQNLNEKFFIGFLNTGD